MAKQLDDEEDLEAPVERKRRRPRKKPVSEEDDEGGAPGRRGPAAQEDDEGEESSLSTGNVVLDILLDFRDDCFEWASGHFVAAALLVIFLVLGGLVGVGLGVRFVVEYLNRPTLQTALTAYDYGSFGEARTFAEQVLRYAAEDDTTTRSGAYFVLGAATCSIAEIAWNTNRQPYYLAAANYLADAEKLGFPPSRRAEGYFLLGKSLYLAGELVRCREPLQSALRYEARDTKTIYWFLANSFFLDARPDLAGALHYIRSFQRHRLVTEDERFEADLLESLVLVQMGELEAAEAAFRRVPGFDRFATMRLFVSGQIAFAHARTLRARAIELAERRDPESSGVIPLAPGPVEPEPEKPAMERQPSGELPRSTLPDDQTPIALPPVTPFDNPETERLLPTPPAAPNDAGHSIWPVFPTETSASDPDARDLGPWPIVSPVPVPEPSPESTLEQSHADGPLFRRMSWMAERTENGGGKMSEPGNADGMSQAGKAIDPDAVIVLPTEPDKPGAAPRPLPLSLPDDIPIPTGPVDPRLLRASEFRKQAAEKYREAIDCFQQVRRRDSFVARWLRTAGLLEGLSFYEMGEFGKGQEVFLQLAEANPTTSEAAAAEFFWAEIEQEQGRVETALAGFGRALDILRDLPNYACPWLPIETIRQRGTENLDGLIRLKEYRQALTMLHQLRQVLPETEIVRYRAGIYEQWAGELRERSRFLFGPEGDAVAKETLEKYRLAGEAYEDLARHEYGGPDYSERLWQSAENYHLGRDYRRGVTTLRKFLRVNWKDRQPEALYLLGEMYIHLDGLDEAVESLEDALARFPNHSLVPRIRLLLARAYYEKKEWDKAARLLQENMIGEYTPGAATYRDSMFALGKLLYDRGDRTDAIPFLEDAVRQYPDAIQAAEANYCLALAYQHRAEETGRTLARTTLADARTQLDSSMVADRENALRHLRTAEELLVKRQQAIGLTPAEQLMFRNALFGAGSLLMRLGLFEEAIPTYDVAATRYQDRPEALDALMQIAVALRRLDRPEDAIPILNRAEVLLSQMEKIGTIPVDNPWRSRIEVQRNLIRAKR